MQILDYPSPQEKAATIRVSALHALAYCPRLFYLEEVEELYTQDAAVFAGRRLHVEIEIDALAIKWRDTPIEESDELEPGVILDYDKDGNVVGIEILKASKQIKFSRIAKVETA
jgi:uncharacterized protein YuzE